MPRRRSCRRPATRPKSRPAARSPAQRQLLSALQSRVVSTCWPSLPGHCPSGRGKKCTPSYFDTRQARKVTPPSPTRERHEPAVYHVVFARGPIDIDPRRSPMTRRRLRLITWLGACAAMCVLAFLTPAAGTAQVRAECWTKAQTAPWTGRAMDVPDVLGKQVGSAAQRLDTAGLPCLVMNHAPGEVDPKAVLVAKQDLLSSPDPDGSVPVVGLWLGVVLPDLTGETLAAARKALSQLGLVAQPSPAKASEGWAVVKQDPAADAYAVFGDAVVLNIEEPVQPIPVPDLVGHTEDEAKDLVEAAKLVYDPRIIKVGARPGRVVSQQPRARELVAAGTSVTADIVREPKVQLVAVPAVVGLDETTARAAIETVGLVFDPRIVKDGSGAGKVVSQSPTNGRRVLVRTAITVDIERSSGEPVHARTTVPDVIGEPEPAARSAIVQARLKLQSRIVRPGTAVAGTVLNQRPLAGTEVDVGSVVTVDLTREVEPRLVAVPDLVDRSEDEARTRVEQLELIFDLVGESRPATLSRHVVRQVPPAGQLVPAGTTVTVELAADDVAQVPWWLGPLLVAGVFAAWTARRLQQRHRDRGPRQPSIHAGGQPLTRVEARIEETGPAHRVRLRPGLDRGRQYIQEDETDERHWRTHHCCLAPEWFERGRHARAHQADRDQRCAQRGTPAEHVSAPAERSCGRGDRAYARAESRRPYPLGVADPSGTDNCSEGHSDRSRAARIRQLGQPQDHLGAPSTSRTDRR
ncbi:PASTA domain-containing protein [Kribbella jiaozuonensis]|uniref:PASTA domain-containing protein n=1 Tax=Kribbella jiaozuonensis TaxID=2575441 RepID=A0A4U3M508_9ACTN|nr:PASTA domain-containing protein [Kribbella jiaozuonensis]TKK83219.1 PASTA domain-containing protein [Kribbella jiaozuonensis]